MNKKQNKFLNKSKGYIFLNAIVLTTVVMVLFFSSKSYAGTDGQELQSAYDKLAGLISGVGGKILALFSGAMGLIGCAVKFNPMAILSFFGVSIGVGSLSFIVDSTVTCMLNF